MQKVMESFADKTAQLLDGFKLVTHATITSLGLERCKFCLSFVTRLDVFLRDWVIFVRRENKNLAKLTGGFALNRMIKFHLRDGNLFRVLKVRHPAVAPRIDAQIDICSINHFH